MRSAERLAVLAEAAEYVLEHDADYIGEEFAARLREALAEPEEATPERDENGHSWRGAFCSRCGADEAGSFAAAKCEPESEEEGEAESNLGDRLTVAVLEVATEELGTLTDWSTSYDGVMAGTWPAVLEVRCWSDGKFATYQAEQASEGQEPHVCRVGEVLADA